jgi:hypothetical protein
MIEVGVVGLCQMSDSKNSQVLGVYGFPIGAMRWVQAFILKPSGKSFGHYGKILLGLTVLSLKRSEVRKK